MCACVFASSKKHRKNCAKLKNCLCTFRLQISSGNKYAKVQADHQNPRPFFLFKKVKNKMKGKEETEN